ncbi:MAG: nucleotidyltransferase family protein [Caldilineaceae bacterium]|nr:nucleotidyltransferase family protein [Caldilineaceae bacterium]
MSVEEIIHTLRGVRFELRRRFHANVIGVFGSVARGDDRSSSDIDILVDFDPDAGLFDLVGLSLFLEELFKRKVDVVPSDSLRPELRTSVLNSVVEV